MAMINGENFNGINWTICVISFEIIFFSSETSVKIPISMWIRKIHKDSEIQIGIEPGNNEKGNEIIRKKKYILCDAELKICEISEPQIIGILLCILHDLFGVQLDRNSIIVNMKLLRNFAMKSKQVWKWNCECNLVRRTTHTHRHPTYFNIFVFFLLFIGSMK